jgi:hypothetical protein
MSQVPKNIDNRLTKPITEAGCARSREQFSDVGNLLFFRALLKAISALLFSAVLALLVYTLICSIINSKNEVGQQKYNNSTSISGAELTVRLGAARRSSQGRLSLRKLSSQGQGLVTKRISFSAKKYAYARIALKHRRPGQHVYLLWRSAEKPEEVHRQLIPYNLATSSLIRVDLNQNWQGDILEIGLDVYDENLIIPLGISEITLLPPNTSTILSAAISELTTVEPWTQRSINHLPGNGRMLPSSTVVFAVWVLCSVFAIFFGNRVSGSRSWKLESALVFLISWGISDAIWQSTLNSRHMDSSAEYSGKRHGDKHLNAEDEALYRFANALKDNALPKPGPRIFLLNSQTPGHHFRRLRTQFHLLPHNIYNFGEYPIVGHTRPGDYIITLDELPNVNHDQNTGALVWSGKNQLPADLLYSSDVGNLYLVKAIGK